MDGLNGFGEHESRTPESRLGRVDGRHPWERGEPVQFTGLEVLNARGGKILRLAGHRRACGSQEKQVHGEREAYRLLNAGLP